MLVTLIILGCIFRAVNGKFAVDVIDAQQRKGTIFISVAEMREILGKAGLNFTPGQPLVIAGSQLTGKFVYRKAGDTYVANEFSGKVVSGEAKIGDVLPCEKDGWRREGVEINLAPSFMAMQASVMAGAMANMFGAIPMPSVQNAPVVDDPASK